MLKALELVGFKSFAEKTVFEFGPGIAVIVGPNGSGKSNVVDAVKWVLGEQSVKSLRGKEMVDVIFNGSSSRHAANMAEVTLTLDNSSRFLPLDADEVHVGRRVYRSGEGEYLLNRQPCRLRDIRDLLASTGIGTNAYSIIEQGRVDALLQASPKDRRLIFEEAAGVARFRAKKLESLRRLERVEQNLVRLKDIVDEVEGRLRTLRQQAAKARRYKELTERLQQLRTQAALADWRQMSRALHEHEQRLAALQAAADEAAHRLQEAESVQAQWSAALAELDERLHADEAAFGAQREQIAAWQSSLVAEFARLHDLEDELARHRAQLAADNQRSGDLHAQRAALLAEERDAQQQRQHCAAVLEELCRQAADVAAHHAHRQAAVEQAQQGLSEAAQQAASLATARAALEARQRTLADNLARCEERLAHSQRQQAATAAELDDVSAAAQQIAQAIDNARMAMTAARQQLDALRQAQDEQARQRDALRQQHARLAERHCVLQELEARQEGLTAGARQVLQQLGRPGAEPLRHVHGVLGQLLHVEVETAQLIELALGDLAGYLLADPVPELLHYLAAVEPQLAGRVGFVWLTPGGPQPPLPDLDGIPGVVGRADRFVEAAPPYRPALLRRLGRTWIVESIDDALRLAAGHSADGPSADRGPSLPATPPGDSPPALRAAEARGPVAAPSGLTFVTLGGAVLWPDGRLSLGPAGSGLGLISRRSELRLLAERLAALDQRLQAAESLVAQTQQQVQAVEQRLESLAVQLRGHLESHAEHRQRARTLRDRLSQLESQHAELLAERDALQHDLQHLEAELQRHTLQQTRIDTQRTALEQTLADAQARRAETESRRAELQRAATAAQVELARAEQRCEHVQSRRQQWERSLQERQQTLQEHREQSQRCAERCAQAVLAVLRCESRLAELYWGKQQRAAAVAQGLDRQAELKRALQQATAQVQRAASEQRDLASRLHAEELAAQQLRLQRENLVARLRDDYGIELAELVQRAVSDEAQAGDADSEAEIAQLRQKIQQMGAVNLEALDELQGLEARFQALSGQYADLSSAKANLEQIIARINEDSRRLFVETLEAVRGHFQALFRKLFGGGQADLVLEAGVDVLESGVDIVARPPGKELRNISLLSGGEKTLTCVALLLAIFRTRPSPFCVLDEVDAALDEANIGRFVDVLHEFLAWTQFIVVTHSKKTMTCAHTLYGVTMQESGVSKRVSVRFEDVTDSGDIRESAGPGTTVQAATPAGSASQDEHQAA
jgi:chromosome segregation protein